MNRPATAISPRPQRAVRRFQTLAEAVDFIAACLEADAVGDLAAEMEARADLLRIDPGWASAFRRYFAALQEIHARRDLRRLYADRAFPANAAGFALGGPFSELEHLAILFARRDDGWVLVEILMYR